MWRQASRYGIPRIAFMNKMDRSNVKLVCTVSNATMDCDPNVVSLMQWSPLEVNCRQFLYQFRHVPFLRKYV